MKASVSRSSSPYLAEAALCPWGPPQQCTPFIEANRVYAKPDLLCDDTDLHDLGCYLRGYPLEYCPESNSFFLVTPPAVPARTSREMIGLISNAARMVMRAKGLEL